MITSEKTSSIYKALQACHKDIKTVKKDAENPFHKSRYAQLDQVWDACKEVAQKYGLLILQHVSKDEGGLSVSTRVVHLESEEWIEHTLPCGLDKNTAQAVGSAITYLRRYGLQPLFGVCPEDDDGNAASEAVKRQEQREQRDLRNERQQRPVNVTRSRRVSDEERSPHIPADDLPL